MFIPTSQQDLFTLVCFWCFFFCMCRFSVADRLIRIKNDKIGFFFADFFFPRLEKRSFVVPRILSWVSKKETMERLNKTLVIYL